MGVKRKHNDEASPTSVSSAGFVSTPDAQSPIPYPQFDGTMEMDTEILTRPSGWDFSRAHRVKNSDWGNRTRKRVRDNRPDERAIHENTVHKLFSAQRHHAHVSPMPSDPLPSTQPTIAVSKPQKSTLHSFWNISAPPVEAPIFSYQPTSQSRECDGARCQDCDAQFEIEAGDMDVDMDMEGTDSASPFACHECGRRVCGTCAVVSEGRQCLQCATRGY